MSVEYIPFDPTLIGKEEIIIWCPKDEDYDELAIVLNDNGVRWVSGARPTDKRLWDNNDNCRWIGRDRKMTRCDRAYYESTYPYAVFMKWLPEQEVTADVGDLI